MSLRSVRVPKYRHRNGSGQSFVQFEGERFYLGNYGFTAAQFYSTASYQGKELSGVSPYDCNLRQWDFAGQDLSGVYLGKTDLREADFSKANLTYATFNTANLFGADLAESNLTFATLMVADAQNANFRGADLTNARCWASIFNHFAVMKQRQTSRRAAMDRPAFRTALPPENRADRSRFPQIEHPP